MELFTTDDFKVFDIRGFHERMQAIATRIRPKLTRIGEDLVPVVSGLVDQPLYAHVARHARRTVNPPDDTWVAIGPDRRGYKKDVHFKVAVSRNCVRLLFEVGPEYYDKAEWALKWTRVVKSTASALTSAKALAWFNDEHSEQPESLLKSQPLEFFKSLGQELSRRRDGQLVLGRRIAAGDLARMSPGGFRKTVSETFKPLVPLFGLHAPRRATVA